MPCDFYLNLFWRIRDITILGKLNTGVDLQRVRDDYNNTNSSIGIRIFFSDSLSFNMHRLQDDHSHRIILKISYGKNAVNHLSSLALFTAV